MRPPLIAESRRWPQARSRPSRINPFRLQVFLLVALAAATMGRRQRGRDHVAAVVVPGLVEAVRALDFALRLVATGRQRESEQPKNQSSPQNPHNEPSTPPKMGGTTHANP